MNIHAPCCVRLRQLLAFLLVALCCAQAQAAPKAPAQEADPAALDLELFRLPASGGALAVLTLTPGPGFYAYANNPGAMGQPTVLTLIPGDSGSPLPVLYPAGKAKPDPLDPAEKMNVYDHATPLFAPLGELPANTAFLQAKVSMLLCSDSSCLPATINKRFDLPDLAAADLPAATSAPWWSDYAELAGRASAPAPAQTVSEQAAPAQDSAELWSDLAPRYFKPGLEVGGLAKAALLALLAGFILNFMPCVLPVVSLKLTGILAGCAIDGYLRKQKAFMHHNAWFAMGILSYFLVLSLVLGSLGLAWGQIFQNASVIMVLTALVFALGLSLFGVFDLPIIDLKQTGGDESSPASAAYFTGVLATLLATPCSGPFLGGVLAWSLLQPPVVVAIVFSCIGLGMASPYLLMAIFPGLVRFFPRPGVWSLYLEKIAAFFLVATCVYLIQILPADRVLPMLILLWVTALAAWIWGGLTNLSQSAAKRWSIRAVALALFIAGAVWSLRPAVEDTAWQSFNPPAFAEKLGKEPLIVDFTADWCVSCKFLEQTVLSGKRMDQLVHDYGLTAVRVDLTRDNPEGMALLEALGSKSIPVVAIFPAGDAAKAPIVLRDLFTPSTLDEALAQAFPE